MIIAACCDQATDGKHIILGMLIVGLIFLGVILLGELAHRANNRRKARKRQLYPY
jgi:hypothetical protein